MILIWSIIAVVQSSDCSTLTQNYMKIVGKQNEVITKSITTFFKDATDKYELEDANNKLSLVDKIQLIENNELLDQYQLKSILSFQVLESKSRVWINRFAVLGIKSDDSQTLIISENSRQGSDRRLPNFNKEVKLQDQANVKYYGCVVLDLENIILDASEFDQEGKIIQNYFYLIQGDQKISIPNTYPYTELQQSRQLLVYEEYIFRGVPKTNGDPSIIQIFQFDKQENKLNVIETIDQQLLAPLMVNQTDYQFELIEFKVLTQKTLIILDKAGNLIQLEQTNKWNLKLLIKQAGECFSFDYNYYYGNFAVIQKNQIISQFSQYELPFELSSYKIHITDKYYVLASNTEIIQLNSQFQQNSVIRGNFAGILFDQHYDDTVVITNNFKVNRYQMQDSVLLKYKNTEISTGTATLTSNGCQIVIDYQGIENNSQELILVNKNQIINEPLITQQYLDQQINTNHQVDGPNQYLYIQTSNQSNIVSIEYTKDLFVSINNTLQLDVIYFQIIEEGLEYMTFYLVAQFQNKSLSVFYCLSASICISRYSLIALDFELNEYNTQLQVYSWTQLRVFLYNSKKITIINFNRDGSFTKEDYIASELDSIHVVAGYFLTLQIQEKIIEVYTLSSMKYLYAITADDLSQLGITDWNPNKLFHNNLQEYVFVQNNKNIIILYIEYRQFTVVYTLPISESKDLKIFNWIKRFGVLYQFDNSIELHIYNRQEITQIYFEKSIPFYDYKIESLNSFIWSADSGVLNVIAKRDTENILLTYLIDNPAHNSLYLSTVISNKNKLIRGLNYYIYYYNEDIIQTQVIQLTPQIKSKIQFNDTTFTIDVPVKLIYSNGENLTIDAQLRLANTQINIFTDYSKITADTRLSSRKQSKSVIDLGNKWYAGQVSKFSIFSEKQKGSISIVQPIEYIENNFANEAFSISELTNNNFFILKNSTYEIKNKSGKIQQTGKFPNNLTCQDILTNNNGKILLKCTQESDNQSVVLGLQCQEDCQFSQSTLQINPYEAYIETDLIFFIFYNWVQIYCGEVLTIDKANLCGEEVFISSKQSVIAVQQIYNNHYHIYNTNSFGEMTISEYNYKEGVLIKNNNFAFNLEELINEKYYMSSQATFQAIKLTNIVKADKTFSADYLIFSTQGPHYGINIQFLCNEADICAIDFLQIKYIFQGYGTFQTKGSIYIKQDYIIIPYIPLADYSQVVTIYQIPKEAKENQAITMLGALYPPDSTYQYSYEIYSSDNEVIFKLIYQTFLLINSATKTNFEKYKISTSPKLLLDGDIDSEQVQIIATNDYDTASIWLPIVTPDKKDDKVIWPWILLGVLGGCLLIGSIMYVYYKRKEKVEESLL